MNQSEESNPNVSLASADQEKVSLSIRGTTYDLETISSNPALLVDVLTELKDLMEGNIEMRTEIKRMEEEIKSNEAVENKIKFVNAVLALKDLIATTIIAKELNMTFRDIFPDLPSSADHQVPVIKPRVEGEEQELTVRSIFGLD